MMMTITHCQWVGIVVAVLCLIGGVIYLIRVAPSASDDLDEAIFPFENTDDYSRPSEGDQ